MLFRHPETAPQKPPTIVFLAICPKFEPFNKDTVNALAAPPAAPAATATPKDAPVPAVNTVTPIPTTAAVKDFQFLLNQL